MLNNGTYKNNPAYNDNLPVRQAQIPQTSQSAPAPTQASATPAPTPSTTVTLSPAAIAAALSGIKPIVETAGHVDQTYSPPAKSVAAPGITASVVAAVAANSAAVANAAAAAKSGTHVPSAVPTVATSSAFGCAGGGFAGLVAGICNDENGNKVFYAGIGSPGPSGAFGTVVNGTAADHLNGFSGTFIGPTATGVGYAPGNPGTISTVSGVPGWSITYGSTLGTSSQPATPYDFHTSPVSNPNECTRSEYIDPHGIGVGSSYSSDAGQSSQISNGGTSNNDRHELDAEAVVA
ncbi:hypothetical protein [Chromobacterium sp. ATCC 53434]|uniref:hypothetical protein n=1 Tax=Chromobacterium sp. (strain ATCC 53434 / SC 14030) TaxID=2059672 RepID=UPI0013052E64|nr:hypothetical protein [Chromobacterium sp. ATCC 53434]